LIGKEDHSEKISSGMGFFGTDKPIPHRTRQGYTYSALPIPFVIV